MKKRYLLFVVLFLAVLFGLWLACRAVSQMPNKSANYVPQTYEEQVEYLKEKVPVAYSVFINELEAVRNGSLEAERFIRYQVYNKTPYNDKLEEAVLEARESAVRNIEFEQIILRIENAGDKSIFFKEDALTFVMANYQYLDDNAVDRVYAAIQKAGANIHTVYEYNTDEVGNGYAEIKYPFLYN